MTESTKSDRLEWRRMDELNSPRWGPNAALIQQLAPDLYEAIQENRGGEVLRILSQGGLMRCQVEGASLAWVFGANDPRQEIERLQQKFAALPAGADLLILLGGAMGYALHGAAGFIERGGRVLLIEPSAARMRACLALVDVRAWLAKSRMYFCVTQSGVDGVLDAVERFHLWGQTMAVLRTDGFPAEVDLDRLQTTFRKRRERFQNERIETLGRLREYPREAQLIRRAWLLDCWPMAPQTLHIQRVEKALRRRGVETERIVVQGYRFDLHPNAYRCEIEGNLLRKAREAPPDLIVSYAYHAPNIMAFDFYEAIGAPWLQVVSNIAYYDVEYFPGESTAVIDRNLIPLYRRRGAPHPFFIPIMADYVAERPVETSREVPIVFVGNSLGMAPQQVEAFFQCFKGRNRFLQAIREAERALSAFDLGLNLYDYLEAHPLPQLDSEEGAYEAFRYLLCQSTAARRRALLERLAPSGLALYGTWDHVLPAESPLKGCLRGVLPMHREPELFARGAIVVNIHSTGHVTGPNMRFFNAAGMGALLLSDGAFGEFLEPGGEYVGFSRTEEMVKQAKYYLAHPSEADEIRLRGWERVRRQWTYDHWVNWAAAEMRLSFPGDR